MHGSIQRSRQSLECSREVLARSESGRSFLGAQGDVPLWPVHGGRATGSDSTYVGIAEDPRKESTVTVTFKKKGDETLMTLVHSDLPQYHELARGHEKGWNYFLDIFPGQFGNGSRKEK